VLLHPRHGLASFAAEAAAAPEDALTGVGLHETPAPDEREQPRRRPAFGWCRTPRFRPNQRRRACRSRARVHADGAVGVVDPDCLADCPDACEAAVRPGRALGAAASASSGTIARDACSSSRAALVARTRASSGRRGTLRPGRCTVGLPAKRELRATERAAVSFVAALAREQSSRLLYVDQTNIVRLAVGEAGPGARPSTEPNPQNAGKS
jgi:hypothetical protein